MRIVIETIPHKDQPYPTCGWWGFVDGELQVKVSDTGVRDYNYLIAVHELVEAILCQQVGITTEAVDDFDIAFENRRKNESIDYEPGEDPSAPYFRQHFQAEIAERIVAAALCRVWREYEEALKKL